MFDPTERKLTQTKPKKKKIQQLKKCDERLEANVERSILSYEMFGSTIKFENLTQQNNETDNQTKK